MTDMTDNGAAESTHEENGHNGKPATKDKKRPAHEGVSRADLSTAPPEMLTIIGYDTKDGPEHPFCDVQSNAYVLEEDKIQNYYHNGCIQNVECRRDGDRYLVAFGRKRTRYLREANKRRVADGLPPMKIRFTITRATDAQIVGRVMMENLMRTEPTFQQKAEMAQRLVEGWGYSPEDVRETAGVSLATVQSWLEFNGLSDAVKAKVVSGVVSPTAALYLKDLPRAEQAGKLAELEKTAASAGRKVSVREARRTLNQAGKAGRIAPTKRELHALSASEQWADVPRHAQEAILWLLGESDAPNWATSVKTGAIPEKKPAEKGGKSKARKAAAALFKDGPADAPVTP
jgi:ParB-like chromosome segregation protein Spo0J